MDIHRYNSTEDLLSMEEEKILYQIKVPIPQNERRRVHLLREVHIIDPKYEDDQEDFDIYTSLVGRIFNVSIFVFYFIFFFIH